jgi:hypothetical protein
LESGQFTPICEEYSTTISGSYTDIHIIILDEIFSGYALCIFSSKLLPLKKKKTSKGVWPWGIGALGHNGGWRKAEVVNIPRKGYTVFLRRLNLALVKKP